MSLAFAPDRGSDTGSGGTLDYYLNIFYPVTMRARPTFVGVSSAGPITGTTSRESSCRLKINVSVTTSAGLQSYTADAEL